MNLSIDITMSNDLDDSTLVNVAEKNSFFLFSLHIIAIHWKIGNEFCKKFDLNQTTTMKFLIISPLQFYFG